MTGPGTVIYAGGGSGGHVFPNLAVAEALASRRPGTRAQYLVSEREVDARIARVNGLTFTPLPAAPVSMHPAGFARFVTRWGPSVRAARAVIRDAKRSGPVALLASGGFVSAPAIFAARAEGIWSAIVNLDAAIGKANRFAARAAGARYVVAVEAPARWTAIPPVVRAAFGALPSRETARSRLGLAPDKPTLLVTGGSQGASSLTRAVSMVARDRGGLLDGWQALHQAPGELAAELVESYAAAGADATVVPFINDMPAAWAAASLAVGRGGAGTIAEAWASGTPLIVLPYPYHRDAHQARNVSAMVAAGAATVVEDRVDPAQTAPSLAEALRGFVGSLEDATSAARSLPAARGADLLADRLASALG